MPQLSETELADWVIRTADASHTIKVRAAYPVCDEKMPGWTVLKDHNHKIVAAVRSDAAISIERADTARR